MQKPPYILDVPADEYHAATKAGEYLTSHRLDVFRRCPAHYKKLVDGEIPEVDTAAFTIGRATHTLVLEGPERFAAEYAVSDGPVNPKTDKPFGRMTKAYAEWAAEQTLPVVSVEDHALMERMRDAALSHAAADLLSAGFAESTVRAEWLGEKVQSRIDWFDPERGLVVDFKTCADVDRFVFDIRDYGYVTQLAFYKRVLKLAGYTGPAIRAALVAVEKKEPHRVAVVELYPMTLEDGNFAEAGSKYGLGNEPAIAELKRCRETGVWPTRYEEVIRI